MKAYLLLLVSAIFLMACESSPEPVKKLETDAKDLSTPNDDSTLMQQPIQQPIPEKRPHKMTLHGHTRTDEYFWLRDDTRKDPQVLAYLEEENAYFEEVMKPVAGLQETLFEEMTARLDPDESSVPYLKAGYWYYSRYEPGKEYAIHARRKGNM